MKIQQAKQVGWDAREGATEPEADLSAALHDVSNALTVVLGWLEVAESSLDSPDRKVALEALEVLRTHAQLGYRIARRAIGADHPSSAPRPSTALSVAHSASVGVRPAAERRGVIVTCTVEEPVSSYVPDAGAALQILTNLLLNAIEFSPAQTIVTVRVHAEPGLAIFTVGDAGPGIAPEQVDTLFVAPDSTRSGGAGIGLRHSYALAHSKGGELRLVEPSPHARFELTWPAIDDTERALRRRNQNNPLAGARVLVVEDDAAVRSLIELALQNRGAKVVPAATQEEMMCAADHGALFDAGLIDLSPIAGNVGGALAALEDALSPSRIILISGLASCVPDDVAGKVAAWVRKPFEMSEVLDALSCALSAPAR